MHTITRTSPSLESFNAGESSVWEEAGHEGWGVQHSSVLSASATLDKEGTVGLPFVTYAVVSETRSRQRPLLRGKRGSNAALICARLSKTRATEASKLEVMPCPQGTLLLHANDTMKTLPHPSPMNSLNTYVGKKNGTSYT